MEEYISLLWPDQKEKYSKSILKLNQEAINDLSLDYICDKISKDKDQAEWIKEIMTSLVNDEEVIKYRQEVFEDIYTNSSLNEELISILEKLEFLLEINDKGNKFNEEPSIFRVVNRIRELESYSDVVTSLDSCLGKFKYKSEGLKRLHNLVKNIIADSTFSNLQDDNKNLIFEANQIKSLTFGMNLNSSLEPTEITLLSINKTKIKEAKSFILNFLNLSLKVKSIKEKNPLYDSLSYDEFFDSRMKKLSLDKAEPVVYHFTKDIQDMLSPTYKGMLKILNRYVQINSGVLVNIIPEISFYLSAAKVFHSINDAGMYITKPEISQKNDRNIEINEFYNFKFAMHLLDKGESNISEKIIDNSVNINNDVRIIILTGANRGGKTTYTQAIGIAQVLFQTGLFVPAKSAKISMSDNIFTHFPADENKTVELGRLGEESKRLNQIFDEATKYSLILLNESLATTNHSEALYIATDVVKGFRLLGCRVVFNTHMHELGKLSDDINNEIEGDSAVVSYITTIVDGERKYKIIKGRSEGNSYANDIAKKHGISFEQLKERISMKKDMIGAN